MIPCSRRPAASQAASLRGLVGNIGRCASPDGASRAAAPIAASLCHTGAVRRPATQRRCRGDREGYPDPASCDGSIATRSRLEGAAPLAPVGDHAVVHQSGLRLPGRWRPERYQERYPRRSRSSSAAALSCRTLRRRCSRPSVASSTLAMPMAWW